MSVIGIDFGNENCFIAVARAGGIETIANEYSQRSTPTYVAFGDKTRDLGVSAKNKQVTNIKNTLFSFKRLIGRKFNDPVIQEEIKYLPFQTVQLPSGDLGFEVSYLNETTIFTVQQVMAMMLTKLKEIAESNLKIKVSDCVLSVPVYYTDVERRCILEAAEIAGLNVLRLMNEPTAVALAYGFYKTDFTDEDPKNVVFIDFGQSHFQASACSFLKGKLKMLGCTWDRNLGGRDFDNVLVRYFAEDFKNRYKLDVLNNKRAVMRLLQECEKLKKQMSANSLELPLNIECFMEDKDVTGRMKRETFEKLSEHLLLRIQNVLTKLLEDTNLKPENIDSVQIVGGSSRLPAFKALVEIVFRKEPSTTLNQDEAVARGCALQCAMLSPTFKVRDFSIQDIQPYSIKIIYKALKTDEVDETEIFPRFHSVPFSRLLTFYRTEPFSFDVCYSDASDAAVGVPKIGSFSVMNVTPYPDGSSKKVKVKTRINVHGIFSVTSAIMLEKQAKEVSDQENEANEKAADGKSGDQTKNEEEMESDTATTPTVNGEVASDELMNEEKSEKAETEKKEVEQKKSKTVVKSIDLPVKDEVPGLSRQELNDLIEKEVKMIMQDKMEKEKADAKNAVEEYVYEFRGKLSAELESFASDQEKDQLRGLLEKTEDWLYDEGEDQQKSVYAQKLNELKRQGDPIVFRFREWEQRPPILEAFGQSLQMVYKALQSYEAKEDLYSHISVEEMEKVKSVWEEKEKIHGQFLQSIRNLKQFENPPVTVESIKKEKEDLERQVWPILSKPKPKVEPPPEGDQKPAPEGNKGSSDSSKNTETGPSGDNAAQSSQENMETN